MFFFAGFYYFEIFLATIREINIIQYRKHMLIPLNVRIPSVEKLAWPLMK